MQSFVAATREKVISFSDISSRNQCFLEKFTCSFIFLNLLTEVHHISFIISQSSHILQESPPAWTQEAYRPPCSKYSLCCPNWVPPPRQGTPSGRVPPRPPPQGTPPSWTWQGTPPGCPMVFWVMLQSIMGYGYGPPPQMWTDWKHYLPPSFGCGR